MCAFYYLSGNRRQLNKLCDKLVNFQITPEDIVCGEESEDNSEPEESGDPMKTPAKKTKQVIRVAIIITD